MEAGVRCGWQIVFDKWNASNSRRSFKQILVSNLSGNREEILLNVYEW